MDRRTISLSPGDILTQVGYSVKRHRPEERVHLDTVVSWRGAIGAAISALGNEDENVIFRRPKTREYQDRLRQIALENARFEQTPISQKNIGLCIRTEQNISSMPSPPRSIQVRDKLKQNLPPPQLRDPYPATLRAELEDGTLPIVKAHVTLSGIDDPQDERPEFLRNISMIWDTGAQLTYITEELLSDWFRRHLQRPEHDPFRGDSHTYVQFEALVEFSNAPVEISAIACVRPKRLMPNNYVGILFGQRQCINALRHMSVPRSILVSQGEDVGEEIWGDIVLYDYVDAWGDLHSF